METPEFDERDRWTWMGWSVTPALLAWTASLFRFRPAVAIRAALARARIDAAALDAVEDVEQAHVSLLTCPAPGKDRAEARRLQGS